MLPAGPHRRENGRTCACSDGINAATVPCPANGHLPKPGTYLTSRYVLGDKSGAFARGKAKRGDTAYLGETKAGVLTAEDFDLSNTEGNSGKSAVVKTTSFDAMALVSFNPALMPYGKPRIGYTV